MPKKKITRIGIGGPVGSGKTAIVEAITPRFLDLGIKVLIITNDVVTTEDAKQVQRALKGLLLEERILGVETGACPHTAVREDPSMNLAAVEDMEARFPDTDVVLIESGGDNLTLTFSPALVDFFIYVIDVAAGDKIPRKNGPGITQSDILVINKTDLAPHVGASLDVMRCDSQLMRGTTPLLFTNCTTSEGIAQLVDLIARELLTDLDYRIPYRAQRALYCDEAIPDLAHVFLITTTGCLLQGDRMALDIALGQGARAHVTTQSATKIHSMDANYAAQTQTFALADDAYLEFVPDPIIPHRRARFVSDTQISVAPSATLLYAEIVQPGRKHHHPEECFGAAVLSMALQVARPGGDALFTEKLLIEPQRHAMRQTGVMGPFDVFGNVLVCTPKEKAERIWQRTGAEVNLASGLGFGVCRLPNEAGLIFKVLGRETAPVKAKVREFWSIVREEVC